MVEEGGGVFYLMLHYYEGQPKGPVTRDVKRKPVNQTAPNVYKPFRVHPSIVWPHKILAASATSEEHIIIIVYTEAGIGLSSEMTHSL